MAALGETTANLARFRRSWDERPGPGALDAEREPAPVLKRLSDVTGFGSNPGNLRMCTYVPDRLAPSSALVVVLHGCTQWASVYDHGAGWSTLADRYGFALLFPEQQRANNPKNCFTWFHPGDIERDRGEALSIKQMVDRMAADHAIDRRRIFVTGLSGGGAMTSVMLATYPDVFAGGAVVAGLPYGCAASLQEAFEAMYYGRPRSARDWGDLVRTASPHRGPWPRVSVWHGSADPTVTPINAQEIVKQWTDVHGLDLETGTEDRVDGYPRRVWSGPDGMPLVEQYTITGMAHGTPLATSGTGVPHGTAGTYHLDVGIASSYHIARFWGLTDDAPGRVQDSARTRLASRGAKPSIRLARPPAPGLDYRPSRSGDAKRLRAAGAKRPAPN
jgi:feruloyl esterase